MREERNALYSLAQAHLVSQYAIDALIVQVGQPVHAFELVHFELPVEHGGLGDFPLRGQHGRGKAEVLVNYIQVKQQSSLRLE